MQKFKRLCLIGLLLAFGLTAMAWADFVPPPPPPGPDYIWVAPYTLPNGVVMDGYWRPVAMDGYLWVEGALDEEDNYIPGHWQPAGPPPANMIWDPGYWNNGFWVDGHWRPVARDGYDWIPSHWNSEGVLITGHWRPTGPAPQGMVWTPGHWHSDGTWIDGYWRNADNAGMTWNPGHYNRNGTWIDGHWRSR